MLFEGAGGLALVEAKAKAKGWGPPSVSPLPK